MSKNGSIRSFFKPVPSGPRNPQPSASSASQGSQGSQGLQHEASQASQASLPPPPSSPRQVRFSPSPSPATPPRPSIISRDAVIHASDDDGDSDASLPDLSTLPHQAQARSPVVYPGAARDSNPCVTPKAKRTALEFHSSPLTLMQRQKQPPKFDLKALLSHAEKDEATEASAQRASALASNKQTPGRQGTQKDPAAILQKHVMELGVDVAEDEDGEVAKHKLQRAIHRTELGATCKRWYFFKQNFDQPPVSPTSFPATAATGRWTFLQDPKTRHDHFENGIPQLMVAKKCDLPDDIFLWLLGQVCCEASHNHREDYINLLAHCHEQICRLVDVDQLHRIFNSLGSRWESTDFSTRLESVQEFDDPYPGREWSQLRSVLRLLSSTASYMQPHSLICATNILLRLGIDALIVENMDVLVDYQDAWTNVVQTVQSRQWNDFCEEVCTILHQSVAEPTLRWQALSCMPSQEPKVHDLRRRLAAVCFFDDLKYARQDGSPASGIRAVAVRLQAGNFAVNAQTDYHDLAAMIRLLDITVDDGSIIAFGNSETKAPFDADIDNLVQRLRDVWQAISTSGAGYISRLEAKTTLKSVQERLMHTVRSRPRPKASIYDTLPGSKDDPFLPKQQDMMKSFLRKAKPVRQFT